MIPSLKNQVHKVIAKHIWLDYIERAKNIRHSHFGKKTIDSVFADAKGNLLQDILTTEVFPMLQNWLSLNLLQ